MVITSVSRRISGFSGSSYGDDIPVNSDFTLPGFFIKSFWVSFFTDFKIGTASYFDKLIFGKSARTLSLSLLKGDIKAVNITIPASTNNLETSLSVLYFQLDLLPLQPVLFSPVSTFFRLEDRYGCFLFNSKSSLLAIVLFPEPLGQ